MRPVGPRAVSPAPPRVPEERLEPICGADGLLATARRVDRDRTRATIATALREEVPPRDAKAPIRIDGGREGRSSARRVASRPGKQRSSTLSTRTARATSPRRQVREGQPSADADASPLGQLTLGWPRPAYPGRAPASGRCLRQPRGSQNSTAFPRAILVVILKSPRRHARTGTRTMPRHTRLRSKGIAQRPTDVASEAHEWYRRSFGRPNRPADVEGVSAGPPSPPAPVRSGRAWRSALRHGRQNLRRSSAGRRRTGRGSARWPGRRPPSAADSSSRNRRRP